MQIDAILPVLLALDLSFELIFHFTKGFYEG